MQSDPTSFGHTQASRPSILRRFAPKTVLIIGLLVAGVGAGLAIKSLTVSRQSSVTRGKSAAADVWEEDPLVSIDESIRAGSYQTAMRICLEQMQTATGDKNRLALYRMGLCQEALGQRTEALQTFAVVLAVEKNERLLCAARLAQARCLILDGNWPEAKAVLARLELLAARPSMRSLSVRGESDYWRCVADAKARHAPQHPSAFSEFALLDNEFRSPVEQYLSWAELEEKSNDIPPAAPEGLVLNLQPDNVLRSEISCHYHSVKILDLLRIAAERGQFQLHFTPTAEAHLTDQTIAVHVDSFRLADLLSNLADIAGCSWNMEGKEVSFADTVVHDDATETREQRDALRERFQRALLAIPDHPLATFAKLELAHLAVEDGELVEAANQYDQLLAEPKIGSAVRVAEYNLGLVCLRQHDPVRARELFLRVVDRNSRDEFAGLGWWWTARSWLDSGDEQAAVKPLKTATKNPTPSVQAAATLGLSTIHLLSGADADAHKALQNGPRTALRLPAFHEEAAFLDALARFRLARLVRPRPLGESEDLLWALLRGPKQPLLGPAGIYLRGVALHELGLDSRMVDYLTEQLPSVSGPWTSRITMLVAEQQFRTGNLDAARELYLSLGTATESETGFNARLRLAEIALQKENPVECLTLCREMIAAAPKNAEAVFRLAGRAYQASGDYRRAAQCSAGRWPEE
jgi:tetratricopeptide (TPR) repeat protein